MSLADYLAKNYLTADGPTEKKSKKRKRKGTSAVSPGLVIAEDDILGWNAASAKNEDDNAPQIVSGNTADFRKTKKNQWKIVGAPAPSNAEQAAADAIIASAAADKAAQGDDDDAPAVVGGDEDAVQMMEDGAHAGLQTGAQVAAAMKKREAEERRRFEAMGEVAAGKGQETIYRDASGRIVNVAMKRAEARRLVEEMQRKDVEEKEAAKGDVQRAEKEARKVALEEAHFMPVARYADDAKLNEELKEREHWDDPAAGFLRKKKVGKSVSGKPLYQGAVAPNRYGIRPGHRWDGVDRGNGFEKEYFAARNRRSNIKDLEYAWQMDE